jgi:DNA polymerase III subunit epsilon
MKVLVFDTETNGLPEGFNPSIYDTNKWPYLLQLSYILYDVDANAILAQNDQIIKIPENIPITEETISINGITRLRCKLHGKPLKEVLEDFNELIKQADVILAHNISFDKRIIMVECIRNKLSSYLSNKSGRHHTEFCTMKAGKQICKIEKTNPYNQIYYKYPTLSELHISLFSHTPENTHDATVDILICLRCFCQMKYDFDICIKNNKIKKIFKAYGI